MMARVVAILLPCVMEAGPTLALVTGAASGCVVSSQPTPSEADKMEALDIVREIAKVRVPVDPRTCCCAYCHSTFTFRVNDPVELTLAVWADASVHRSFCLWVRSRELFGE